ncbi:hypothetical protein FUSO4_11430 [Fusobacterium necrophorum DJ-1]|uniref:Uncharacterized protein n=2 Tax=Fusobacterium necrophorum TaxID=859 RepID=A0AB73BXP8_9FUSO|nr:hypothetical protein FUSO4_11430 [Fusobacterium necrophorum DJ-1]KDE64130.1 hypothetical protein FUSO3_03350 [Fusobacterium necrophorum BL]KDE64873.1 hypothetical protein FUSO5_05745 [Fusobacterium necrophorum BFTR-1]KDE68787.1 hypothetical protein FUSO8_12790 [Fusobacterium necrophorum DJ-2]KDE74557.1 hypothetical protein FUSO7_02265 [Fusobacterium necrophorum BFTR-2]
MASFDKYLLLYLLFPQKSKKERFYPPVKNQDIFLFKNIYFVSK